MNTSKVIGGLLRPAGFVLLLPVLSIALLTGCETPPAAPDKEKISEVFDLKDVDQEPVPISQQRPRYPTAMRRAGASGGTVIRYVVDTEGKVRDARAIKAAHPDFAAAAVESVSGWKFKPGMKNGRPVNTRMQSPVVFTLRVES